MIWILSRLILSFIEKYVVNFILSIFSISITFHSLTLFNINFDLLFLINLLLFLWNFIVIYEKFIINDKIIFNYFFFNYLFNLIH